MPVQRWAWFFVLAWMGCARPEAPAAEEISEETSTLGNTAEALFTREQVDAALKSGGLLNDSELRELVLLASDAVGSVYATPGVPGDDSPIQFVFIEAPELMDSVSGGTIRYTLDGWVASRDLAGVPFASEGLRGVRFSLPPTGKLARLEAAFLLQLGASSFWIDQQGKNYVLELRPETKLTWAGDLRAQQEGLRRQLGTDAVFAGHALTVQVDTYPQSPRTSAVLHWSVDGRKTQQRAEMSLVAVNAGETSSNARWAASLPVDALVEGANVQLWVEVKGPKNTVWGGEEPSALVVAPPSVGWAELGAYRFNKCHPVEGGGCRTGWFYGSGLAEPFSATPGDYQAYASAPSIAVELYVPGVTDSGEPSSVNTRFVRAQVYSPFFSGSSGGAWKAHEMDYAERSGNNWRFKWDVRQFRVPMMPAIGVSCVENGDYAFKLRLSTDGGKSWQWLGTGGLPLGGENRTLHWENFASPRSFSLAGDGAFGDVAIGGAGTRAVALINTQSSPMQIDSLVLDDASGSFGMSAPDCYSLGACGLTLRPGEGLTVALRFAPTQIGEQHARLRVTLTPLDGMCGGHDEQVVELFGNGT